MLFMGPDTKIKACVIGPPGTPSVFLLFLNLLGESVNAFCLLRRELQVAGALARGCPKRARSFVV